MIIGENINKEQIHGEHDRLMKHFKGREDIPLVDALFEVALLNCGWRVSE